MKITLQSILWMMAGLVSLWVGIQEKDVNNALSVFLFLVAGVDFGIVFNLMRDKS